MRVAGTVTLIPDTAPDLIAAAWLHDVVEDTDVSHEDIRKLFGSTVSLLVHHMTNEFTKSAYPKLNRKQRKQAELLRLARANHYYVHTLKLADRYDNTFKLSARNDKGWTKLYLKESKALANVLTAGDAKLRQLLLERIDRLRKKV